MSVGEPHSWKILLDGKALPLSLHRPVTVGSDDSNEIQLGHSSVRGVHARLRRVEGGILLELLDDSGTLTVNGSPVSRVKLTGGEEVKVGGLAFSLERGEIAPAIVTRALQPLTFEQEFQRALGRELRRAPWFLISIVVHVLLLLWARDLLQRDLLPDVNTSIQASMDSRDALAEFEDDPDIVENPPEPPEDFDLLPEIPLEPEEVLDNFDYLEDVPITSVGLVELADLGAGSNDATTAVFGGRGINLNKAEGPLKGKLQSMRDKGLDVVFLVDTTASMETFLRAAKQTVDRMITDMADLIPSLRLGVVAYRDEGDEYVTKATPLSADRYAILNFLEGLRAKGGGDVPEAVLGAVEYALDELEWRKSAHRVILIVADAPPHAADVAKLRMRIQGAVRSSRTSTVVSTIFTGRGRLSKARQVEAEQSLREISKFGGGEFAHLEDTRQVTAQMVSLTLGSRFRKSVESLLGDRRTNPRFELVSKRVKDRDVDWLIRKLTIPPVEPEVVAGLIKLGNPAVAMRCLDVVSDVRKGRDAREAALYILKKITRYDGDLDLGRSLTQQEDELKALQLALERAYRGPRRGPRRGS